MLITVPVSLRHYLVAAHRAAGDRRPAALVDVGARRLDAPPIVQSLQVPVAAVGVDNAKNAAVLAARILALPDPALTVRVIARARPEMSRIWSEEGKLARWLEVELAALDGWVEVGAVPAADVSAIRAGASTPSVERVAEIEQTTDHDLAAFVDAVAEQVGSEGRWFHYGLTSSDVVDTALALQIRGAGALIVRHQPRWVVASRRAPPHVCIGRSHGIHAEPTTFG